MELVVYKLLLYIVNKNQCSLFSMCSFFNSLFSVTGNTNIVYSKNRIGNRHFCIKLSLFFNLTQLAESIQKNLGKPRLTTIDKVGIRMSPWVTQIHFNPHCSIANLEAVFCFRSRYFSVLNPLLIAKIKWRQHAIYWHGKYDCVACYHVKHGFWHVIGGIEINRLTCCLGFQFEYSSKKHSIFAIALWCIKSKSIVLMSTYIIQFHILKNKVAVIIIHVVRSIPDW